MDLNLGAETVLPEDRDSALLIGRVWRPGDGPSVVTVRGGRVIDISAAAPTVSELLNGINPRQTIADAEGDDLGAVEDIIAASDYRRAGDDSARLLAPIDLQAIKACGVTFVESMLERVIEEAAKGDPDAANDIRRRITADIGVDLNKVVPGSDEAAKVKDLLIERGLWSQYLEVGIGPDAEVFTKAPPMAGVGVGAEIGLHPKSTWNNPEPEIVLVINALGQIKGATLGNDVNLRDFEGRSALLLGKAKDNNGSAALGPFIRLFDESFSLDDVRNAELTLRVEGEDGFVLDGQSSMAKISRDVTDLAAHAIGPTHQYPDGLVLYTGTLFAPTKDRDTAGHGFTHKVGDIVRIQTPKLGALINRVNHADKIPPWVFGTGTLMRNLAKRGLLQK